MIRGVPNRRSLLAGLLAATLGSASTACRERAAPSAARPVATPLPRSAAATFVGREACKGCHAAEYERWKGSHHDLAMQEATEETVLGDFGGRTFTHFGVTSTFFKRDGKYFVKTDGPDGKLHEYPIAYTFGVYPLQQYLIPFPGGRYQALNVVWDTRPKKDGGQRWFHLYPKEAVPHDDPLHWTGPYQNWNFMCAECHSTNVKKGFLAAEKRYETTFSEIDVSCEACHGPGSAHVAWAKAVEAGEAKTRRRRQGPRRRPQGSRGKGVLDHRPGDRAREAQRPPHLTGRDRDLRPLPCAALGRRRGLRLRPAAHADPPPGAPRRGSVLRRRPDPGRGLRVRILSPEQDAREGRELLRLPQPPRPQGGRLGGSGLRRLPRPGEIRHPGAPLPQGRLGRARAARAATCRRATTWSCTRVTITASACRAPTSRSRSALRTHAPSVIATAPTAGPPTRRRSGGEIGLAKEPPYGEIIQAGREGSVGAGAALAVLAADPARPAIRRATAASLFGQNAFSGSRDALVASPGRPRPARALRSPRVGASVRALGAPGARGASPPGSDPHDSHRRGPRPRPGAEGIDASAGAGRLRGRARRVRTLSRDRRRPRGGAPGPRRARDRPRRPPARRARVPDRRGARARARRNVREPRRSLSPAGEGEPKPRRRCAGASPPRPATPGSTMRWASPSSGRSGCPRPSSSSSGPRRTPPLRPRYAYVWAIALDSVGQTGRAIEVLEAAERKHGGNREILEALVSFHAKAGHRDAAALYAKKLQDLTGPSPNPPR